MDNWDSSYANAYEILLSKKQRVKLQWQKLEGYTDTAEENWHSWISLGVNLIRREVVLRIDLACCTKESVQ